MTDGRINLNFFVVYEAKHRAVFDYFLCAFPARTLLPSRSLKKVSNSLFGQGDSHGLIKDPVSQMMMMMMMMMIIIIIIIIIIITIIIIIIIIM